MEDNKMYCKPIYKCGICGKEWPTIAERAACEMACIKRQEEDARRLAEEQKKTEQKTRKDEVTQAIEHAAELLNKYINDYGSYSYDGKKLKDTSEYFWPSRLWHYFL